MAVNNEHDSTSFNFPRQAIPSIAIDPFDRSSSDIIQYMHSGVGVIRPNGLTALRLRT